MQRSRMFSLFSFDEPSFIDTDFAHEVHNPIDQCKISIPILTKNYASSTWCLDELADMVEWKRRMEEKIMPIFYKVEHSHCFGEKMLRDKEWVNGGTYDGVRASSQRSWVH